MKVVLSCYACRNLRVNAMQNGTGEGTKRGLGRTQGFLPSFSDSKWGKRKNGNGNSDRRGVRGSSQTNLCGIRARKTPYMARNSHKPSHVTSTFEFCVILNRFVLGTKTHRCRCPSCRSSPAPCRCCNRARTIRTRTCTPTPSSCWSCTARGRCSCSGSPPGYSACRSNLKQRRISADAAERKSS